MLPIGIIFAFEALIPMEYHHYIPIKKPIIRSSYINPGRHLKLHLCKIKRQFSLTHVSLDELSLVTLLWARRYLNEIQPNSNTTYESLEESACLITETSAPRKYHTLIPIRKRRSNITHAKCPSCKNKNSPMIMLTRNP